MSIGNCSDQYYDILYRIILKKARLVSLPLEKGNLLCGAVMGGAVAGGFPKNSNGLPTALSRNDAVEIYPL